MNRLWVVFAAGCAYRALDEVPVRGGTREARAIARDELARFDAWIGRGRVVLREVRIVDAESGVVGRYHRGGRTIDLDAAAITGWPGVERYALRHELCHALDLQEGLLARPTAPFDHLAAVADPSAFDPSLEQRGRRSEVMAYLCTPGPWATVGLRQPCPGDADAVDAVARWFADEVWLGAPDVSPPQDAAAAPTAGLHARFAVDGLEMEGLADGSLAIGLYGPDDALDVRVDPWTGRELPGDEPPVEPSADGADWPHGLAPDDPLTMGTLRADDGEAAAVWVSRPDWLTLDLDAAPRVFAREDGAWTTVGRCVGTVAALATTPGAVWAGWAEGSEVAWAPVAEDRAP